MIRWLVRDRVYKSRDVQPDRRLGGRELKEGFSKIIGRSNQNPLSPAAFHKREISYIFINN